MMISNHFFAWDEYNRLFENDGRKYSFESIMGVKCLGVSFPDGKKQINGTSPDGYLVITQSGGEKILVKEYYKSGLAEGKEKRASWLSSDGNLDTFRQYWYDENGIVIRKVLKGDEGNFVFWKDGDRFFSKNENRKDILWEKEYDSNWDC